MKAEPRRTTAPAISKDAPSQPAPSSAAARRAWALPALLALALLLPACRPSPETREHLARLRSKDISIRLKAIADAEAHPNPALRAELLRMFQNEGDLPLIRGYAAIALGHCHDPQVLPAVLKRLPAAIEGIGKPGPRPPLDAFLLSKALVAYGPESLPALSPLLEDSRKDVVAWTIMHHGAYRHDDRACAVLARYLDHRDPILRGAAAFGLSLFAHPRAETLALAHLPDSDPEVRFNLAWALFNYGSGKSVPSLEAQLSKEKDPRVREELVKALSAVKSRSVPFKPAPAATGQPPPRKERAH